MNPEIPQFEQPKNEAIGIRILGESDPKLLTREEFETSSDLLFHGTACPVSFSPEYNYRSQEYITNNDGSTTLGFGFYSTDDKQEASAYSIARQNVSDVEPIVISILPYQANVLDLRQKNDPRKNASIPKELAQKWKVSFLNHLKIRPLRKGNIGAILDSVEYKYVEYLNSVLKLDEIDLRVLLGTAPSGTKQIETLNYPSPPWTILFSDFMITQGYDGLVYNEGGEGLKFNGGASYVFYNLKKIGTYESWNKEN